MQHSINRKQVRGKVPGTQQLRHINKIGKGASTVQRSDSLVQPINQRFLSMMILIVGLISGCASMFPGNVLRSPDISKQRAPNLTAPYNKPYKVRGVTYYPLRTAVGYREVGHASWYGSESGNRTAMGTRFVPHGLTAAHKTLPLPSRVRVTNLKNGRQVDVLVNDRGPFMKGRIIDLSRGAAQKIGLHGVDEVKIEHLNDRISQN
ncbi:septal ring lytic transglycosylase RlpA family protein [Nitrosomonas ureae]|uniref:Endolytic peptidoglycan transglycosylase RlpA n=1 Tax=Nitrosomonas ureae TaxID=44577 RepID=A0A1H5T8V0_9PROT|nr:septal ring lytic transglycosylase RlpA family protein [Nitrosomonas ureae]SEF59216.1 rare lipoprotein A [Nitrosomonas ureae]